MQKWGLLKLRALARDKEIADLKIIMAQSEDKFYNMGFTDAENSNKPIMLESRRYGFGKVWMAAMNALGVRTYVIKVLGTYVTILCNWLIF